MSARAPGVPDTDAIVRILHGVAANMGTKIGWPSEERLSALPHIVECRELTRESLLEAYEGEMSRRRAWLKAHEVDFEITPIITRGRHLGKRFNFADETAAVTFRLKFSHATRL